MKALGHVVSEKILLLYSNCKSMGAIDPRGGSIFDPRGHDLQDLCKAPNNNAAYQI